MALIALRRMNIVVACIAIGSLVHTCEGFSSGIAAHAGLASRAAHKGISAKPVASSAFGRPASGRASTSPLGLRMQEGGEKMTGWELWTRPRTTNANWGVFFEVATKDKDVWVTGLRAGGHAFADAFDYNKLNMRIFTTEGSAVGKELDASKWTACGEAKDFRLPRVEVGDSYAQYYSLPFEGPIHIPAGTTRSFCVHTDKARGLALRRKLNFDTRLKEDPNFKEWVDGVSDEGMHFNLVSGLVPGQKLFEEVSTANNARAFVGVVEYDLKAP